MSFDHSPPTACRHTVSGTISLPSQGFFSPFPHGTGSLSVRRLYLALRDGPRRFPQGSTCPAVLRCLLRVRSAFAYAPITLYGASFQRASASRRIGNSTVAGPTTPDSPEGQPGLGYVRFRSPLLSESLLFSFPLGTEMVHFPRFARARLWIHRAVIRFYRIGFPHSEIPGSKPACGSPRLIAACHVLHRHRLPRHSPCALSSLTIKFTQHIRAPVARPRLRKLYVAIGSSLRPKRNTSRYKATHKIYFSAL